MKKSRLFFARSAFLALILIIIGLLSVNLAITRDLVSNLYTHRQNFLINNSSVVIYQDDTNQLLAKISPLDDFIYQEKTKDLLATPNTLKVDTNIIDQWQALIQFMITGNSDLIWNTKGNNQIRVKYRLEKSPHGDITIQRVISNLNTQNYAFGQSIVFCQECLVTDQSANVYFSQEFVTGDKEKLAYSLTLKPNYIDSNQPLPKSITEINILDQSGNIKLKIPVYNNQEIYLDEKWNKVEFKTFFKIPTSTITLQQKIYFN